MRVSQIRPYGNIVLVKLDERLSKIGNIHLPGNEVGVEIVGDKTGKVIAAGPGAYEKRKVRDLKEGTDLRGRMPVKKGDRVLFRGYLANINPVELDVEDEGTFFFIHVMDLSATLDDDVYIGDWSGITKATA